MINSPTILLRNGKRGNRVNHYLKSLQIRYFKSLAIMILSTSILAGCGSSSPNMITSFKDMTQQVSREGGSKVDQNRILSITGQMSQAFPGQLMHYNKKRGVSTAFGLTDSHSYLQIKTIKAPDDAEKKMICVRNAIQKAQTAGNKFVEKRMALLSQAAMKLTIDDKDFPDSFLADSSIVAAEETMNQAIQDASEAIKDSGLIIVRWQSKNEESARIKTSIGGYGSDSTGFTSGYAIFAGLREITLFVGPDVKNQSNDLAKNWDWFITESPLIERMKLNKYIRITTYTLQSQHVLYLQDQNSSVSKEFLASLDFSKGSALSLIQSLSKVEISKSYQKVQSLSNQGFLGCPTWTRQLFHYKMPYFRCNPNSRYCVDPIAA